MVANRRVVIAASLACCILQIGCAGLRTKDRRSTEEDRVRAEQSIAAVADASEPPNADVGHAPSPATRRSENRQQILSFEARRSRVQLDAGLQRLDAGDVDGAVRVLRKLLGRDPQNEQAQAALIEALLVGGREVEAERLLRGQLERQPNRAAFHHELAMLLETSGRVNEAMSHFRRALHLEPGNQLYQLSCAGLPSRSD